MSHLSIAMSWMDAVLRGLERQGLDRADLAPEPATALNPQAMTSNRLELVLARGIWARASLMSDDPALGVKVGSRLPPQASNVLAVLGAHARTRRAALGHIFRYQLLLSDSGRFRPIPIAGGLRVVYEPAWPDLPISPLQIDSVMAAMVRDRGVARRVRLIGRPAQDPAPFEAILRCPIELGARQASADYADDDLDAVIPGTDPVLHDLALAYAESLLAVRIRRREVDQSVRAAIAALGLAQASMAKVAAELGCSPRTLQRRLEASDTSFRETHYSYRIEEAGLMLYRTQAPIEYISDLLGYSEPSAFSRTVHEWWGIPPRALRTRGANPSRAGTANRKHARFLRGC